MGRGAIFLPRDHLAVSGNIFGCHNWGVVLNPVGGAQGYCQTSYSVQDSGQP